MRYRAGLAFVAALLAPVAASAQGGSPPPNACIGAASHIPDVAYAIVLVNGQCFELTARMNGKVGSIETATFQLAGGSSFTLSAEFDADPFVNFVFGSVNAGAVPLSFDVSFTTPVIGGPYNTVLSNGTGSVQANGGGTGTVTHNAGGYAPAYVSGWTNLVTHQAVDLPGTSPCSAVSNAVPTSCLSSATSAPLVGAPPVFLTARLSYTHSVAGGGASTASFIGGVELTNAVVPEPATVTLVAMGVVVLGAAARRRRA